MIKSDHKPLQHLLEGRKGIPVMASARVQRWAITLSTQFSMCLERIIQMLMFSAEYHNQYSQEKYQCLRN